MCAFVVVYLVDVSPRRFYKEVVVLPLEEDIPEKSGDVKVADP